MQGSVWSSACVSEGLCLFSLLRYSQHQSTLLSPLLHRGYLPFFSCPLLHPLVVWPAKQDVPVNTHIAGFGNTTATISRYEINIRTSGFASHAFSSLTACLVPRLKHHVVWIAPARRTRKYPWVVLWSGHIGVSRNHSAPFCLLSISSPRQSRLPACIPLRGLFCTKAQVSAPLSFWRGPSKPTP
jgi:hypothetical protein